MRLLRRVKYLLHRGRRGAGARERIAFHRELAEQEQREAGLPPEARAARDQPADGQHHAGARSGPPRLGSRCHRRRRARPPLRVARAEAEQSAARHGLPVARSEHRSGHRVVQCGERGHPAARDARQRPGALVRLWVGNGNLISWPNLHDVCDETPGVSCAGYRVDELMWQQRDESIRLFGRS